MQIFCLPHAGGSQSAFARWRRHDRSFDIRVQTWADAIPEAGARHAMDKVAATIGERIAGNAGSDFCLVGASAGARLAYRIAEWLEDQRPGRVPTAVVMIAPPPAQLASGVEQLLRLDDAGFVAALRALGGVPAGADISGRVWRPFVTRTRRQLELIAGETEISCRRGSYPVHFMAGLRDPLLPPSALPSWMKALGGDCQLSVWPGDHFFWQHNEGLVEFILDKLHPYRGVQQPTTACA